MCDNCKPRPFTLRDETTGKQLGEPHTSVLAAKRASSLWPDVKGPLIIVHSLSGQVMARTSR